MRAHQLADVERREALEHAVPDHRDQRRRDQQLRKAHQRVARQFAARRRRGSASRAAPPSRARSPRGSRIRRASESARPSVMISRITSLRRVPKISRTKMSAMLSAMTRAGRSADLRGLDGADHGRQHRAHQFLEQALLVAEVEIDRALGDAGAPRDVVEAGRGKAGGGEFFERGGEDRVAPLGLAGGPDVANGCGRRRGSARATPRPLHAFCRLSACASAGHIASIQYD